MRKILLLLYLTTLLIIFAVLVSCSKEPVLSGGDNVIETLVQEFSVGTRADKFGNPKHGDAYTLISYNVGGTSSNTIFKNQISETRQFGYYAYDDGLSSDRLTGTLVPVVMKFPTGSDIPPFDSTIFYKPSVGINPLVINRAQAQALQAVPLTGLNPANNIGLYRTAIIYPAIPLHQTNTAGLGQLAVYHIGTNIWASSPDDADGNPDTNDPFEIMVNVNGTVHELPNQTELFPIKSAIGVWFYSEYYTDDDPTTAKTQTFNITSLKLVNVGSNGWYNARTGIVYPNYNYNYVNSNDNWRLIYSATEMGVKSDGTPIDMLRGAYNYTDLLDPNHNGNGDDSMVKNEDGNDILPPKRSVDSPAPTKYIQWSAEVPVFPSDYRGAENGGLTQVKPLSLRIELDVGIAPMKATIPIAMVMERGKKYNFYVNVMSEIIGVSYNVTPWAKVSDMGEIGGEMTEYMDIDVEYKPGGWGNGGGGTENIGDEKF